MSAHFVELRAFFQEAFRPLAGRVDFLEKRMDRLEKRLDGVEKRMEALEKRMDFLEKRMDFLEKRMDALEKRMDAGFARLESRLDLFIATQGGINRRVDRELRALKRRPRTH